MRPPRGLSNKLADALAPTVIPMTYATNSTSAVAFTACGWCGDALAHGPGACRAVKSVEYYPDGTLKRVEKFTDVELRHATAEVGTLLARSALLR